MNNGGLKIALKPKKVFFYTKNYKIYHLIPPICIMRPSYLLLFLSCWLLIGTPARAQQKVVQSRSKAFFELRGLHADFTHWSVRYTPTDTAAAAGFALTAAKSKRGVTPFFAVAQEFSFWNRLLARVDWSIPFIRDNNFNISVGLGYQQPLLPNRPFPMFIQAMVLYEYWNFGVCVGELPQGSKHIKINKTEFIADQVFVFLGNRRHSFRPQLGFTIRLHPMLDISLEGYYNIVVSDRARVSVRGKSAFARHNGLWATDSQIEVYNDQFQPVTHWKTMDQWGVRLGFHFKPSFNNIRLPSLPPQ